LRQLAWGQFTWRWFTVVQKRARNLALKEVMIFALKKALVFKG
jgi:hypothetical protein